jgi:transcriptional regulator
MSSEAPTLHVGRRFRVDDRDQQLQWLATYNLGTLISTGADGWPRASTSPLLIRSEGSRKRVFAHLDRRNPQVEHLEQQRPLLYVAHGPRAYVSPGWFPRRPAAPTYLHVTVQVRGRAELVSDEQAAQILLETVAHFEHHQPQPWQYDSGQRFLEGAARGVAAFELVVGTIDAACKLSQDRSEEEQRLIAAQLAASCREDDRRIAEMMRSSIAASHHLSPSGLDR